MPQMLLRDGRPALATQFRPGASPAIVFLPGYMSDMEGTKAVALDAWAEARGQAALRLDYAGCGASEGVFAEQTLVGWRDDVLDAIDRLAPGPLVLVGSSMGGWLMLLVALARPDRVQGLIGIAAAPDFTDWGFDDERRRIIQDDGLLVEASDGGTPVVVTRDFWRSGQANLLLDGAIAIDCPVRLLHGQEDREVPVSTALRLGRALRSADVQLVLVKGGDHRLSRPQDIALLLGQTGLLIESL